MMTMRLNRDHPVPLYEQIAASIRKDIREGKLKPGNRLASHDELADTYQVSRITIRKAIEALVSENVLIARQGKGVYVAGAPIQEHLLSLQSLSEVVQHAGNETEIRILSFQRQQAPIEVSAELQLEHGSNILSIERLHIVNDEPLGFAHIFIPLKYGDSISLEDVEQKSVYHILEMKLGVKIGRGVQQIRACAAPKNVATYLNCKKGSPVLFMRRTTFSKGGEPVEYIEFFYRADRYAYTVQLERADHESMWPR